MTLTRPTFPTLAAALLAALLFAALLKTGFAILLLVLLGLAALALLNRPTLALAVAIALPVLIEADPTWGPGAAQLARFYDLVPGTKVTPVELMILLAFAAAFLRLGRVGPMFRDLSIMRVPLGLLVLGLLVGAVTGYDAGIGLFGIVNASRNAYPLLLLPLVIVALVGRSVSLRDAMRFLFALAAVKAVVGLAAFATGLAPGGLTYYLAPANLLTMFALVFLLGAAIRRLPISRWAWAATPFLFGSLLFSYRRSIWVATALSLALMFVLSIGYTGRRYALPVLAAGALVVVLSLSGHIGGPGLVTPASGSPSSVSLKSRFSSLNPTAISASKDDRYRVGERRNVLADLRQHPISGLGLGMAYTARYPLSIGTIPHDYVHFGALWWWMKAGIAGLIGYVAMLGFAIFAGVRMLRHHPDRVVAVGGGAAAAATVGLAVAELTATFIGPDPRASILGGVLVGILAVGYREATEARNGAAAAPA